MEPRRHVLGPATVSRIGFGAMQLPGPGVFGPPRDRTAAIAVLRRAVALGVDHVDTAQYYGPGVANELIRVVHVTRVWNLRCHAVVRTNHWWIPRLRKNNASAIKADEHNMLVG